MGAFLRISVLLILIPFLVLMIAPVAPAQDGPALSLTNPPWADAAAAEKVQDGSAVLEQVTSPKVADYDNIPQSTGFDYPVGGAANHDGFEMNNCFGCTWTWMIGHTGEDFDNGRGGDPVFSASEGVVVYSGLAPGGWGNVIIIEHNVRGRIMYTQYAHLQAMYVGAGQIVGRRQQIGIVGMTGTVAPHLHFEVKDQPVIGHGYAGWSFSGTTIFVWGINYYAPSWYIDNNRHIDSPFGYIDSNLLSPGKYSISGWALDPDSPDPIDVHMYLDGQGVAVMRADGYRPDLAPHFPSGGVYHGFSAEIHPSLGNHTLCVYGINVGAGHNNLIGCVAMDYPAVMGSLDHAAYNAPGRLSLGGWAIDPDTTGSIDVHVYIDEAPRAALTAGGSRSDVAGVYPVYGAGHGYSLDLTGVSPGRHTVCTYGINVGSGGNALLGCRVVEVPVNPFGSLDGVGAGAAGELDISGWAADPDTAAPIDVHVYVNGAPAAALTAGDDRPDVGAVYPGWGSSHGFSASVAVRDRINTVCAYGINEGPGGNALLGCRVVEVPVNPFGSLDGVSAAAGGRIDVSGWAIDPGTTAPIDVHIYVNGTLRGVFSAGGDRPDVGAVYPDWGASHGYSGSVSGGAGDMVCTYGINVGSGGNALLGCRRA